jgi:hypothetical protein
MSKEEDNKTVVGRWFTEFWGKRVNLGVVDEIAAWLGGLPAATGRKMQFTGTTVLKVINGKIVEEIGLDDGVTALTQLGLIKAA